MLFAMMIAAAAVNDDPRCASIQTSDLIACAEAGRRGADADLNAAYQAALKATRAQDADLAEARSSNSGLSYSQALIASERTWIAYRDAQCRLQTYANWGGHELPIYQRGCLATLTRDRTKQLRDLVGPQ